MDDPRESPSFELIEMLLSRGANVTYSDPHVPVAPAMRHHPDLPAMKSVELTPDGTTFRPSTPVPLFTERRGGPTNWHYDMDPRAERFLLIAPPGEATADALPPPITLIVNFTQGLGRK